MAFWTIVGLSRVRTGEGKSCVVVLWVIRLDAHASFDRAQGWRRVVVVTAVVGSCWIGSAAASLSLTTILSEVGDGRSLQ